MTLPTWVSVGAITGGTGAISVPWGASHAAGDVGILLVETSAEAVTTPSGWTLIGQITQATASSTRITAYRKYAASGAEANVTVADPGDHAIAVIAVVRGVDQANPIHAVGLSSSAGGTTIGLLAGLVTQVDDCLVLAILSWQLDAGTAIASLETNSSLANFTERHDAGTTDGNGGGLVIYSGEKATRGTVDPTACTLTSVQYATMAIALQPPQSSGGSGYSRSRVVNA